ncbi:uncharacterized protein NECHADRAFT_83142 [Fusarium vanettenii 77-13-4]|uniref:F-box domain-containing protein n=1 Tax=Fusarium vanettenii (strain ATCC MYA-4622 / CBS 123669 / FGSC 9596 / NRRL 45880 / 77-13-4) TaxID=660122 RepID=C7ZB27_FUSV7|nr:uncharacterized protein NECHADRAFT_83142 [Fusarium vanettenii 77-13-4]EEU38720.1 hypothetical protein NECHADRAFT_83142 [Fusarium vanettenii 77-13-4]
MECDNKRKQAASGSHPPDQPDPALYYQQESIMFRLPQELRLEIYSHLFSSTSLQWTVRKTEQASGPKSTPLQTLALVRACRRIRDEISDSWISQIHLTFKTPEAMLDVLTELPVSTLSKIRHVQVTAKPVLTESPPRRDIFCSYFLGSMFKLLPGLRLDTLTVHGTNTVLMCINYLILNHLISGSCGWKELYYITRESAMIGSTIEGIMNRPQPENWQRIMNERDGDETKPTVIIYRPNQCVVSSVILDHDACAVWERDMPSNWLDELPVDTEEEKTLFKDEERGEEMMVVVKRGFSVDYEETEGSPLLEDDIRRDGPGMTWKEIQGIDMEAPEFLVRWLLVFAVQMGLRTRRLMRDEDDELTGLIESLLS